MSNKQKTGLGTAAFFQQSPEKEVAKGKGEREEAKQDGATQMRKAQPKVKEKVRTTVTLYRETLAGMEALKIQERKTGNKATFSDILNEAIQGLMDKKGIKV